jgi:hypothetical protein
MVISVHNWVVVERCWGGAMSAREDETPEQHFNGTIGSGNLSPQRTFSLVIEKWSHLVWTLGE